MLMNNKLQFPESTLPGQFFNDFLNGHPVFDIYEVNALDVEHHENMTVLLMHSDGDLICIDHTQQPPRWVSYDVYDKDSALDLNWFITDSMHCTRLLENVRIYGHPTGVLMTIARHTEGFYTYLLSFDDNPVMQK